jgi:hypothetical protein
MYDDVYGLYSTLDLGPFAQYSGNAESASLRPWQIIS